MTESNNCPASVDDEVKKEEIIEGKAKIILDSKIGVFYNPVQEFNRDLSIAALSVYAEEHYGNVAKLKEKRSTNRSKEKTEDNAEQGAKVCDTVSVPAAGQVHDDGMVVLEGLSASGLRSIRYAKEVPGLKQIVANDFSKKAVISIQENIKENGVEDIVTTSFSDASLLMYKRRDPLERFHVVDLDPYGCPSTFLNAAVQSCADGGLLLVTCTDMAVLAGNNPETSYSKYGALAIRNDACHEMALRIALQSIETHANRYGRYIEPVLSFSADFYIRVIVRIRTSAAVCKKSIGKLAMIYQCVGCETRTLQPLGEVDNRSPNNSTHVRMSLPHVPAVGTHCSHCNHRHIVGGPIWTAPIHDVNFVSKMVELVKSEEGRARFNTARRMEGMLTVILEELPDVPLYYGIDRLCSKVHTSMIAQATFVSAILNAGYRASDTHARKNSVKTDAPPKFLWDIIRAWEKDHPTGKKRRIEGSVTANILSHPCESKVDFTQHPDCKQNSKMHGLCRYIVNPPFWGPGCRSTLSDTDTKMNKQKRNQNKNSKRKLKRKSKDNEEQTDVGDDDERSVKPKLDV